MGAGILAGKGGVFSARLLGQSQEDTLARGLRTSVGVVMGAGRLFLACSPDPGAWLPASAWAGKGGQQLAT